MAAVYPEATPELARKTISSVNVHGVFRASPAVKEALAGVLRSR